MHWCVDVVFWHFGIVSIAFVSLCGLLGLLLLLLFVVPCIAQTVGISSACCHGVVNLCTVTAPVSLEVSSNASLLLALLLVFWRFHLLLALLMPSCLLRFVDVDNGGLDPLGTLAHFAMVEMILFDDVVVLCFCCDVCFCVVVEERLAFGVGLLSGGILRGMSSMWWRR
jgi:hypothetical protein